MGRKKSMDNLFKVLPSNFFSVFARESRVIFADCIFKTYQYFANDVSYTTSKDSFMDLLKDYFEEHETLLEDENKNSIKTVNDKANFIYTKLKDCGWINEDIGENYEIFVTYEDYAINIIETLMNLDKVGDITYSGLIHGIYSSLMNFEPEKGALAFENAYNQTIELEKKLRSLNSNIKKYIQHLLDDGIKDDLNNLLDELLEYQVKIVDRAYYNLKTFDNPDKYKLPIINRIEEIRENEDLFDLIVSDIVRRREVEPMEATNILNEESAYIQDAFDNINNIMHEIDKKNKRFVASAINRIVFLLNNKKDIEGKINGIMKMIGDQELELAQINSFEFIDDNSLYMPRTVNKPIEASQIDNTEIDPEFAALQKEKYLKMSHYSRKQIEREVLDRLSRSDEIRGSDYRLDTQEHLAKFILTFLYGFGDHHKYDIEMTDNLVEIDGYKFKEFYIRSKKNG